MKISRMAANTAGVIVTLAVTGFLLGRSYSEHICNADSGGAFTDQAQITACTTLIEMGGTRSTPLTTAYNNRAVARHNAGNTENALTDYDAALRYNDRNALALSNRGQLYAETDRPEKALADFDQSLRINDTRGEVYRLRGDIKDTLGDLDGAISDYNESLRLEPGISVTLNNRGYAWKKKGETEKAKADYVAAFKADATNAVPHENLHDIFEEEGDFIRALGHISRAADIRPRKAGIRVSRGYTYQHTRQHELAFIEFDTAIGLDPGNAAAWNGRANAHSMRGDDRKAIADYNEAIKLDPDYFAAYYGRAMSRRAIDDIRGALADNDKAVSLEPDNADAYLNRGNTRLIARRNEEAIADFDKAISLAPSNPELWLSRGYAWRRIGNVPNGLADYTKALELDPDYFEARERRCWLRALANQSLDLATADCRAAIGIASDVAGPHTGLCLIAIRTGDNAGAEKACTEALTRDANDHEALFLRGIARQRLGKKTEGESDLAAARQADSEVEARFAEWGLRP